MRAANHHGRGTAKHARREFDVSKTPHIDPARTAQNRYWSWDGQDSFEASERAYYQETFADALDAQNEQHRQRRQYKRVREMEQVYQGRNTQPEGSLLYIGCKKDGPIDPAVLWACAEEYRAWEQDALGGHYVPLTMALHVDEDGQFHVEERGVYQYQDEAGNWQIGQAAALEAAGVPLPDPSQPRSKENNRKMSWDAARREKWLDVVEAHGFKLERTPEAPRPHLGLEAWQAYQDAKAGLDAQAQQQAQVAQIQQDAAKRIGEQLRDIEAQKRALEARRAAQDAQAAQIITQAQKDAQAAREAVTEAIPGLVREAMQREIEAARAAQPPRHPNAQRAAQDAIQKAQDAAQNVRQPGQRNGPGYTL